MNIDTLTIIQILTLIIIFVVIVLLYRQEKIFKLDNRIGKYAINPINAKNNSIYDNIRTFYYNLINKLGRNLNKSKMIKDYSKRYEKYVIYDGKTKAIDYVSNKIIISVIFIILYIIAKSFQGKLFTIEELILNLVIGYYLLDLYLIINKKRKKKIMKNQLLRAIIIMNNAFKSGKSTLQAVQIASKEVGSPLKYEFEKMYKDINYGLSIDTVFERFSKRIDIEEAKYISSSLTTLNKTGGNIVKVFNSIEKTLFDKKRLNEELKNLTVSSNLLVKVLTVVPIVFILIIYLLNPSYFNILFTSSMGYMIIILIVLMFIIYIIVLQRIMKVKV